MPRKARRDRTEVSCLIKYLVFGFNVVFWLLGASLLAVGVWAWSEKDMFAKIGQLTKIPVDPAMILIIVGAIMFIIGFSGCVGALRENTCLLLFYCVAIGLIFFAQLILGVLGFVYRDWVKEEITGQLKVMIEGYRDDIDLQNLIDWVQKDWLKCCGVKDYNDWDDNVYFNCSASPKTREACGVPFSCCQPQQGELENKQCGYDVRNKYEDLKKIYTIGCLESGEKWLEANLIPVAGVAVGIAALQILGICFGLNLRSDIKAQRAKWR